MKLLLMVPRSSGEIEAEIRLSKEMPDFITIDERLAIAQVFLDDNNRIVIECGSDVDCTAFSARYDEKMSLILLQMFEEDPERLRMISSRIAESMRSFGILQSYILMTLLRSNDARPACSIVRHILASAGSILTDLRVLEQLELEEGSEKDGGLIDPQ